LIEKRDQTALKAAITAYSSALEIQERLTGKHSADAAARLEHKIALCRTHRTAS